MTRWLIFNDISSPWLSSSWFLLLPWWYPVVPNLYYIHGYVNELYLPTFMSSAFSWGNMMIASFVFSLSSTPWKSAFVLFLVLMEVLFLQEPCFPCGIMGDLEWLCNGWWVKLGECYLWVAVIARSCPCFVGLGTTTCIDCTDRQSTKWGLVIYVHMCCGCILCICMVCGHQFFWHGKGLSNTTSLNIFLHKIQKLYFSW